jgi:hypothetical protein
MNICKNCKYWILKERDEYSVIIFPFNPITNEHCKTEEEAATLFGCRVRRCKNPKLLFYHRPERIGATVVDGSEYHAELITGEEFGCIGFEEKTT